jgi:hypothetical protein
MLERGGSRGFWISCTEIKQKLNIKYFICTRTRLHGPDFPPIKLNIRNARTKCVGKFVVQQIIKFH